MPSEVILPRVDMDMATGKISKWLVPPGATVTKGQPLFEIETDKATMEIEAEADGTIRDLVDASAKDIPVGSVVAWIDAAGEAAAEKPAAAEPAPAPPHGRQQDEGAEQAVAEAVGTPRVSYGGSAGVIGRERATPLARRLAREHGIALADLRGSGPRGRIQASDVAAASKPVLLEPRPARSIPGASPPATKSLFAAGDSTNPETTPVAASAAPLSPGSAALVRLREGDGTPLVLIHGFGSEANGWRPFLTGQSFTGPVFGLDLPGHGGAAGNAVAGFDDLVDAAESALLEAGLTGAINVVGHSLGGAVAASIAARGMLDVRSLLLLSPAGLGPEINGGFLQGYLGATSETSLRPWMLELVVDPQTITPALVRATLKARQRSAGVETQRRVAAAVFPDGTQCFSIRADLARLRMPVRVIFGTDDRIIPARHAAGLPPLVALHLLPNIGHMPHFEASEVVTTILNQVVEP